MASTLNAKTIHRDGKTQLRLGIDENSKIFEGHDEEITIKNSDGSFAKISKENIPCIPEDASETNKLVTQKDLRTMISNIQDIIESANNLAKIVGGLSDVGDDDNGKL